VDFTKKNRIKSYDSTGVRSFGVAKMASFLSSFYKRECRLMSLVLLMCI